MNPRETVQAFMDAIQTGDFETAYSFIAHDEFFCTPTLSIVGMMLACPWMEIGARLKSAFPDLDYHFNIENVDGNIVRFSTRIQGTHTHDLDLTTIKMDVVPATYKSIATNREYGFATVRDGRIISWAMEHLKCTNLLTLLEQLDIEPQPIHIT